MDSLQRDGISMFGTSSMLEAHLRFLGWERTQHVSR